MVVDVEWCPCPCSGVYMCRWIDEAVERAKKVEAVTGSKGGNQEWGEWGTTVLHAPDARLPDPAFPSFPSFPSNERSERDMATIRCDIVSAEQEIFHGEAEMIVATGEMGELGIAPRHAPLITRPKPGDRKSTRLNSSH